jgi:glycine dehydrogenase subunit 1
LSYIPHTADDRAAMLQALGLHTVEELFEQVPADVRLDRALNLPPPASEIELRRDFAQLTAKNSGATNRACFLGAGLYDHYIPSVVDSVIRRNEFYTAYTPYQPEVSQGTLQVIYEFQSMVVALTGMDVANASMYDGASALAEAAVVAMDATGRSEIVIAGTVHPAYRAVVRTYMREEATFAEVPPREGVVRAEDVAAALSDRSAALLVQQPNFFGCLEDLAALGKSAKTNGALFIVSADPISLGLLAPPGEYGADIVTAEGQPLGIPMSFGGPLVGLFAVRQEHLRRIPGRIVGATTDNQGRRGYTLTLQTREQHIRRERATSNICTNQGLCATAATAYMGTMGREGFRRVAELCLQKAHYAAERIAARPGYSLAFGAPFFKEFTIRCLRPAAEVNAAIHDAGFIGGYDLGRAYPDLGDCLLLCVTEKRTREEIDALVAALPPA